MDMILLQQLSPRVDKARAISTFQLKFLAYNLMKTWSCKTWFGYLSITVKFGPAAVLQSSLPNFKRCMVIKHQSFRLDVFVSSYDKIFYRLLKPSPGHAWHTIKIINHYKNKSLQGQFFVFLCRIMTRSINTIILQIIKQFHPYIYIRSSESLMNTVISCIGDIGMIALCWDF